MNRICGATVCSITISMLGWPVAMPAQRQLEREPSPAEVHASLQKMLQGKGKRDGRNIVAQSKNGLVKLYADVSGGQVTGYGVEDARAGKVMAKRANVSDRCLNAMARCALRPAPISLALAIWRGDMGKVIAILNERESLEECVNRTAPGCVAELAAAGIRL